ncbi:MAG: gamma-glutamylcyclotransferase [Flavobacteriales bacterium]|nr:gamma-glutamylcyclotransferase [Flavobacteriales bacterium]
MKADHVFVYGTLRRRSTAAERDLLLSHARYVGIGRVANAALFVGEYPMAVPVKAGSRKPLVGEVYRLPEEGRNELLAKLDEYEELRADDPERSMYRREVVKVDVGGKRIACFIYWYNGELEGSRRLHQGNILRQQVHLVPNGKSWSVKLSGAQRSDRILASKEEALKVARRIARKQGIGVIIHGRDGKIRKRLSVLA